ncbi:pyruvate kinase [Candidatus Daviesbacteria bacterium RIFCSPHIGHO2_12_FULL_47_45]|nr:MAG: pyruvate kinase [Candidatus Daviesbacteria bacterium RIFCSPHIGHO2_12_FULL_47_45]
MRVKNKKTKIVCTIGPSSWDYSVLKQLALAGMDVARLNFSHGTHAEKAAQIVLVRRISRELDKPLAIIADMQGPKIRIGQLSEELLKAHANKLPGGQQEKGRNPVIILKQGEKIHLSISPISDEVPMYFDLSPFVKKGHRILLNDGLVEAKVTEINGKVIVAVVQNDGYISSHKGVNVPDTRLPGASLTPKDYEDAEFALKAGVDFLAISFVQSPEDLKKARDLIKKYSPKTKLIVKLEKPQAVENLEEIVRATDAIMVARGDLAIETDVAEVPLVQKRIIRLARQYFKPVIVATQMLESMTENPRPTRAEVSDVANAVFDQADAVMLSGETANGKYPVKTVKMMNDICLTVEGHTEYKNYVGIDLEDVDGKELANRAIASAGVVLAELANVKLIIAGTVSGKTVQSLSSFRPQADIVAICNDSEIRNQLVLVWGVRPFDIKIETQAEAFWNHALELIKRNKLASKNDQVIILSGPVPGVGGQTDTLKLETL